MRVGACEHVNARERESEGKRESEVREREGERDFIVFDEKGSKSLL